MFSFGLGARTRGLTAPGCIARRSSLWYPGEAGQVKKSGHILMKGDKPCKVIDIKVSKTGKHGHGKCRFTAIDIFDGSKHEVRDVFR